MLPCDDLPKLTAQLMRHEGTKRAKDGLHIAYRCSAGALTIGYGHNLDANPVQGIGPASRLNEDQARRLLAADIAAVDQRLKQALPFVVGLDGARYAALLNMAFNLGMAGLLSFHNTLADIQRGDYQAASKRMLQSKWAGQVGQRALELSRQMRTGEWA